MRCARCGFDNAETAQFCAAPSCGFFLLGVPPPPPVDPGFISASPPLTEPPVEQPAPVPWPPTIDRAVADLQVDADDTLTYSFGVVENPSNPFGHCALSAHGDGRVRLDHEGRGGVTRAWTGMLRADAIAQVWVGFDMGVPESFGGNLLPGTPLRKLTLVRGGVERRASIPWYDLGLGWGNSFQLLDVAIRQLSRDTICVVRPVSSSIVYDIEDVVPAT
jgi:hypothetical protein